MILSSFNIHRIDSINIVHDFLDGIGTHVTRIIIKDGDGSELEITCFSDKKICANDDEVVYTDDVSFWKVKKEKKK